MKRHILMTMMMLLLLLLIVSCDLLSSWFGDIAGNPPGSDLSGNTQDLCEIRNNDVPYYNRSEYEYAEEKGYFIELSPLDEYGRVGMCWGLFDKDHMPDYERDNLDTNPTGWHQNYYDPSIVPGGWLYSRSHLLAFQLSGLQDNPQNLMTGTRDFNNEGMLPYENITADHIKEEDTHRILYRVTPDFGDGGNLLAYGVLIESDCLDCDDDADFCVYVHNIQTGITLDYTTGRNWLEDANIEAEDPSALPGAEEFIINTSNRRFHIPTCRYVQNMNEENKLEITAPKDWMTSRGYDPCSACIGDESSSQ